MPDIFPLRYGLIIYKMFVTSIFCVNDVNEKISFKIKLEYVIRVTQIKLLVTMYRAQIL